MALGYCNECRTLRSIVSLGQKWGSRECEWAPIPHTVLDRHEGCDGRVAEVDVHEGHELHGILACDACLAIVDRDALLERECRGAGRPIR